MHEDEIKSKIEDAFLECDFVIRSSWNAEIIDVQLNQIDILGIKIISLSKDNIISASIDTELSFSVDISGHDPLLEVEDDESDYYYSGETDVTLDFSQTYDVLMDIYITPEQSSGVIEIINTKIGDENIILVKTS